mmetsp:Transcript_5821/g.11386  ORF Transcript_5821/g.11386 Transcript_5821/m.11386 type:complete len:142 (-) Transcript_5821:233-658(-)|eukprot:scaffold710_cov171-Amphora_coffeaeformis.AAC.5
MPLLLIPVAAVGYKLWEERKRKAEKGLGGEETGEPNRVVDTLPSDDADKLQHEQDSDSTKGLSSDETFELIDANSSSVDDDDQTRSTMSEEQGPLSGVLKFFEEKMDERRARELKKQKARELAEKIVRGEMPVALPKISYK